MPADAPTAGSEPEEPATEPTAVPTDMPTDEPSVEPEEPENGVEPAPVVAREQVLAAPERVTICHRTNSRTNPYNQQSVSFPQAEGHANQHTGPIFSPDGPRPWGDIIPPIPAVPEGRNWPEGRAILENGCEVTPDPGPLPSALIADVECEGTVPTVQSTVSNAADATDTAFFNFFVDGVRDDATGQVAVAPGESRTVTLDSDLLATRGAIGGAFPIEARTPDGVVASKVVTVDCSPTPPPPPPAPDVEIVAEPVCDGTEAFETVTVTNNGPEAVTVTTSVNGEQLGEPLVVAPGGTATKTTSIAQFEDENITIQVFVDGDLVATYNPTPDCDQSAVPRVAVAALECAPGTATATLANDGDPASSVVFTVRVNGQVAQETAPLYGGDVTTIVGDLDPYEDRSVIVDLLANGEVLGSRTIYVDCRRNPGPGAGGGSGPGNGPASVQVAVAADVLPATGAAFDRWLGGLGGCLTLGGAFLLMVGRRGPRSS